MARSLLLALIALFRDLLPSGSPSPREGTKLQVKIQKEMRGREMVFSFDLSLSFVDGWLERHRAGRLEM